MDGWRLGGDASVAEGDGDEDGEGGREKEEETRRTSTGAHKARELAVTRPFSPQAPLAPHRLRVPAVHDDRLHRPEDVVQQSTRREERKTSVRTARRSNQASISQPSRATEPERGLSAPPIVFAADRGDGHEPIVTDCRESRLSCILAFGRPVAGAGDGDCACDCDCECQTPVPVTATALDARSQRRHLPYMGHHVTQRLSQSERSHSSRLRPASPSPSPNALPVTDSSAPSLSSSPPCLPCARSQHLVASLHDAPLRGPSPPPLPGVQTRSSSSVSSLIPILPTMPTHASVLLQHRDTPYNNPKVRYSMLGFVIYSNSRPADFL